MRVEVNGIRIFFDVEGAKLVPDGPIMREKPTLIVLHGGPGSGDHSFYKPRFSPFAEIAQVVYIDHRGNGRSAGDDPASWNLAQWGDDLLEFCRVLEIETPIVLGTSFGGFVAMSYATRHPEHPGKLILNSTQARFDREASLAVFERLGGVEARAAADRFLGGADEEAMREYARLCLPLYLRRASRDRDALRRVAMRLDVTLHFERKGGQSTSFDFTKDLGRIQCPALVLSGEDDPITPVESGALIAELIPGARLLRYADSGHGVFADEPRALEDVRAFLLE